MLIASQYLPALQLLKKLEKNVQKEYLDAIEEIGFSNVSAKVKERAFAGLAVERAREVSGYRLAIESLEKAMRDEVAGA